jgi:hypothetical protein
MQQVSETRVRRHQARQHRQARETGLRIRRMSQEIEREGLLRYVQRLQRSGQPLPYPFSDHSRWGSIAADASAPGDWREVSGWLLRNAAN